MNLFKNREGATMAEYAVIAVVLILVAIIAFTDLGTAIAAKASELATGL